MKEMYSYVIYGHRLHNGLKPDRNEVLAMTSAVRRKTISTTAKMQKVAATFLVLSFMLSFIFGPGALRAYASESSTDAQSLPSQVLVVTQDEANFLKLFREIEDLMQNYHTKDVDKSALYEGALRGLVQALNDPYSQYMTQQEMEDFSSTVEGTYVGIGVTIDIENGKVTVVSAFKGSPAEAAGIRPGDVLVSIDGQEISGKSLEEVSGLLKGPEGTQVTVKILRASDGSAIELVLTRALISVPTLDVKDMGNGIYYIAITQFTPDTGRQFPPIINYLKRAGLKGLILDLRNNPGGTLDSCVEVADALVPKGPIVELRRKELKEVIENTKDTQPIPVVVLINGGTASAAEILAGAIRDRGVGILLGEHTFGKACVQALVPLGEGAGAIKLTIADYYTPNGQMIAGKGLAPDIEFTPQGIAAPQEINYKRVMKPGTVGLDVLALQENLKFLGYQVGELDGIFGPRTLAAVNAFLSDHKMPSAVNVTKDIVDLITQSVASKLKDQPDQTVQKALEVLRQRINSGSWQ